MTTLTKIVTTLTNIVSMMTTPATIANTVLKADVTRADAARISGIAAYS